VKSRAPTLKFTRRAARQQTRTTLTAAVEPSAPAVVMPVRGARMRRYLVVGAMGVVIGGTSGSVLAWRGDPANGPSAAWVEPPAKPDATPTEPAQDLHVTLVVQIKETLSRFVRWSDEHAGAPCPDITALGVGVLDPWGRKLRIVCADQPVDQIAGVLSLGPDGAPGTHDDVVSWALGTDVTSLVRGARWSATKPAPSGTRTRRSMQPPPATAGTRTTAKATVDVAQKPADAAPKSPPAAAPPSHPKPPHTNTGSNAADGDIPDRR
jgi:hypothetical protein